MLDVLSKLEDQYSFGLPTGVQVLALATETKVSDALVVGEMPMDLDVPVEDPCLALPSARPLGECSLSSCPDSGMEDFDIEDGAQCRRFSHLLSERMSAGRPLFALRMQRHRTPAKASSFGIKLGGGRWPPCAKEQGTVFKQNHVAITRDTLREDMAPPSFDAAPRAEPLRQYLGQNSHV